MKKISNADIQYNNLAKRILEEGYYDNNRTGIPTKKLFGQRFEYDLEKEFPILTTKQIFFKSCVRELLWIYVLGSNKVSEVGSSVWAEWAKPDGTIGPAYGAQIRHWKTYDGNEVDQVQILLDKLKNNQQDRGMVMSMWNVADLPEMALRPCAFITLFDVSNGKLNCTLLQRSADLFLGIPWNFTEYAVLIHMLAQISGLKPGKLIHYMNNVHIYENHFDAIKTQLEREPYEAPKLWIDPSVTDFNQFKPEHFKLIGYKYHPRIDAEVAV